MLGGGRGSNSMEGKDTNESKMNWDSLGKICWWKSGQYMRQKETGKMILKRE